MARVSVGLEVGAAVVKMVELAHGKKAPRLTKLARVEIPPGLEGDDRKSAIIKIIKSLVADHGMNPRRVISGVGGESVIVRRIMVPTMPDEELTQALRWQAEEYLPYSLDEVYLDFHVLGRGKRTGDETSVMLVGVKKETVDIHLDILKKAGIIPQILDVNALALFNIFEFSHPQELEDIAVVEMGHSTTCLLILEGECPFLVRNLNFGGLHITRAIAEKLGVDYSRANQLKEEHGLRIEQPKGEGVSSDTAAEISDQIKKCMRDLINEILHSLDYYSSQKGKKIKKIFISGGSAYLNNVSGFLSGALGLPVERHNPFVRIGHNPRRFSPDYLEKEGSFFAVGSGLALREVARI